jgi:hypothetical protein
MSSSCESWSVAIEDVVHTALKSAEALVLELQTELSFQLRNNFTEKSKDLLCGQPLTLLMGILALCGGFQLGLVPGSMVDFKATATTVSEESMVLGYGTSDKWSDLFRVQPLHNEADKNLDASSDKPMSVFNEGVESCAISPLPSVLFDTLLKKNESTFIRLMETIMALDTTDERVCPAPEASIIKTVYLEFESSHPYSDNVDDLFEISVKGAKELMITFDPGSRTENNYDYLTFFKDASQTARWGEEKYSGTSASVWPGAGTKPALVIKSGSCFCLFHSDGSNNGKHFISQANVCKMLMYE